MLAKTEVHHYAGNNDELGTACGKFFCVRNNTLPLRKSEIEYYAMLAKTGVQHYAGNNNELGTACGKYFRVCNNTDFVPSMREALKCWNMTVQHWLVLVVYKRFPVKSLRTAAVMFVSSLWHGVHPSYYLELCSARLCLVVEDRWRSRVRARLGTRAQGWYDWGAWVVRMRWFDYLGMAFLLLRIDATLTYWSSVYYTMLATTLCPSGSQQWWRISVPSISGRLAQSRGFQSMTGEYCYWRLDYEMKPAARRHSNTKNYNYCCFVHS